MFFAINPHDGIAIYEQIDRQVRFAVAADALQAGDLVPSVRELARQLAVNPNTVARAYQQLQSDGVLKTVRGMGLAVAAGATKSCRAARQKVIRERLQQVFHEAKHSQLSEEDLRSLIDEELARAGIESS